MNENPNEVFIWLIGIPVVIIITAFIIRWLLKINKQIRLQEAQLKMLEQIARKNEVPEPEIKKIMDEAGKKWGE